MLLIILADDTHFHTYGHLKLTTSHNVPEKPLRVPVTVDMMAWVSEAWNPQLTGMEFTKGEADTSSRDLLWGSSSLRQSWCDPKG